MNNKRPHDEATHAQGAPVHAVLDWLRFHGASGLEKFRVGVVSMNGSREDELGIFARENIAPGQVLASVPQDCVLSADKAKCSNIGKTCLEVLAEGEASDEFIFLLWLMIGRADKSHPMHTYLNGLPVEAPTPMAWPPRLRAMLSGTNLGVMVDAERIRLEKLHTELVPRLIAARPDLFSNENCSLEAFLWAHGMWHSRRYPTALAASGRASDYKFQRSTCDEMEEESDGEGSMVPFFDFFNHSSEAKMVWGADAKAVTFTAGGRGIEPGDQVFNNYGEKGNEDLMYIHGFAILDNVHDTYSMWLTVQLPGSEATEAKAKAGKKARKAKNTTPKTARIGPFLLRRIDPKWDQIPGELWQALADPPAAAAAAEAGEVMAEGVQTIRFEVPPDHVQSCLTMLKQRLQGFTETKVRDRHFASGGAAEGEALDPRIMHIARYRDGQRQVLEEAVRSLESMLTEAPQAEEDTEGDPANGTEGE
eukprot:TRINITY_DN6865_c0_g1_i1.p1 TRINITY_DN6865_c0_g1~~TRINITY_DN6865_c0_g1_i1.p1  ORF type:complete len:478 (+),score=96.65 TRINITY_DN6865_c0_g1_i1:54-1487(+)